MTTLKAHYYSIILSFKSLSIKFHNIVVWGPTHGTNIAALSTLDTCSDMATRDESCVCICTVAHFAHFILGAVVLLAAKELILVFLLIQGHII